MTKLNLRKMPDSLPMQMQEVRLLPSGVDAETRMLDLVWTTGATVRRRRFAGWDTVVPFDEILIVSDKAIDLSRMNAGAPVLDSHSVWSTFSQVAVVERAWVDGGEGKASIRFPKAGIDERADRMFGLVSDGIIKNVSVGYSIDKIRIEEAQKRAKSKGIRRTLDAERNFVRNGSGRSRRAGA
ncbi:hypothetical protein HED54_09815 [Ochrobactrum anthropi ATCC 49188]|nr:hypothetical protein [Brucella anthropi ATCC 49188]